MAAAADAPCFSRPTHRPCSTALWLTTKSKDTLKRSRSATARVLSTSVRLRPGHVSLFSSLNAVHTTESFVYRDRPRLFPNPSDRCRLGNRHCHELSVSTIAERFSRIRVNDELTSRFFNESIGEAKWTQKRPFV